MSDWLELSMNRKKFAEIVPVSLGSVLDLQERFGGEKRAQRG